LFNLVVSFIDFLEIFEVKFHQPIDFLVIVLSKFVDESLPLDTIAVLNERRKDRNNVFYIQTDRREQAGRHTGTGRWVGRQAGRQAGRS